jgi:hypothetical protein
VALFLAFVLVVPAIDARPHPKLKKIATAIFIIGLNEGAAWANTLEVARCRPRAGVEKCETGYGAWKGAQVGYHALAAVNILITYKIKHIEEENGTKFKTWPLFPLAAGAGFSYMAANQASQQSDPQTHCEGAKKFNGFGCE